MITIISKGDRTWARDAEDLTDLLSVMLEAQESFGQITWEHITKTYAYGTVDAVRVVVFDVDNSTALAGICAVEWVNNLD